MSTGIRPVALAVVFRGAEILVFEGGDRAFYRPLGGGIEFGESAVAAVRRELREELGAELSRVALLGVLENIFTAGGEPGHEIVFVFTADLADPATYAPGWTGRVLDEGSPVTWQPVSRFRDGTAVLYPSGLLDLLDKAGKGF